MESGVCGVKRLGIVEGIGIEGICVWGILRIMVFCDFEMGRKVYGESE